MENTSNYKYYRLEVMHLKDDQYIIKMAFCKKVTLAYLENKYNSAYLGLNPISSIAYDGQKPIAFYGAYPQLFSSMKSLFFFLMLATHLQ